MRQGHTSRKGWALHPQQLVVSLPLPRLPISQKTSPSYGVKVKVSRDRQESLPKSCPKYANILQLGKEEVPGLGQSRQAGVNQQRWATRCSLESGFIQEGCRAWPGLRSGSPLGSREGQRVLPLLLPTPPEGFPHAQVSEQPT